MAIRDKMTARVARLLEPGEVVQHIFQYQTVHPWLLNPLLFGKFRIVAITDRNVVVLKQRRLAAVPVSVLHRLPRTTLVSPPRGMVWLRTGINGERAIVHFRYRPDLQTIVGDPTPVAPLLAPPGAAPGGGAGWGPPQAPSADPVAPVVPAPAIAHRPAAPTVGDPLAAVRSDDVSMPGREAVTLALVSMTRQWGVAVLDDPRRSRAILLDLCAENRRDVNVVVAALEAGVPRKLRAAGDDVALRAMAVPHQIAELEQEHSLAPSAARFAVQSVARAMGLDPAEGAPGISGTESATFVPTTRTTMPTVVEPWTVTTPHTVVDSVSVAPPPPGPDTGARRSWRIAWLVGAGVAAVALLVGVFAVLRGRNANAKSVEASVSWEARGTSVVSARRQYRLSGANHRMFEATVTLANVSGRTAHYVYDEVIPKSVASSTRDLTFVPQPSRIVNDDPVVRYEGDLTAGATMFIRYARELGAGERDTAKRLRGLRDDQLDAASKEDRDTTTTTTTTPEPAGSTTTSGSATTTLPATTTTAPATTTTTTATAPPVPDPGPETADPGSQSKPQPQPQPKPQPQPQPQPTPDTTPPTITLSSPVNGRQVTAGAGLTATYACADTGGSALASCTGYVTTPIGAATPVANGGTIDTSSSGSYNFTVNAKDGAGNPASQTVSFTVVAANHAPLNSCAGSAINLSFSLTTTNQYWINASCFSDADGDSVTVYSSRPTSGAAITPNTGNCAAGRWCWMYTPVKTATCYADSVTLWAQDPSGARSAVTTVTMNVC